MEGEKTDIDLPDGNETPLPKENECFNGIFESPFSCVVVGASQSGKSYWVWKIIENDLIQPRPKQIIWCYRSKSSVEKDEVQSVIKKLKIPIVFKQGIPVEYEDEEESERLRGALVVQDDLMMDALNSKWTNLLYTVYRQHKNCSVITMMQSLRIAGPFKQSVLGNVNFVVMFKSARGASDLRLLGSEIFPQWGGSKGTGYLLQAYSFITSHKTFSYLVMDLRNTTAVEYRLFTHVFNEEFPNLKALTFVTPNKNRF